MSPTQKSLEPTSRSEPASADEGTNEDGDAVTSVAVETEELGFGEALGEIEQILARIEGDEVDIDQLATALGEAANLLDLCRKKIRRAEAEVEQVSQRLVAED